MELWVPMVQKIILFALVVTLISVGTQTELASAVAVPTAEGEGESTAEPTEDPAVVTEEGPGEEPPNVEEPLTGQGETGEGNEAINTTTFPPPELSLPPVVTCDDPNFPTRVFPDRIISCGNYFTNLIADHSNITVLTCETGPVNTDNGVVDGCSGTVRANITCSFTQNIPWIQVQDPDDANSVQAQCPGGTVSGTTYCPSWPPALVMSGKDNETASFIILNCNDCRPFFEEADEDHENRVAEAAANGFRYRCNQYWAQDDAPGVFNSANMGTGGNIFINNYLSLSKYNFLQAKAYDSAGNSAVSSMVTVTAQ